ncbi:MAG TPA: T9SS type A sorting domain-containing protein [bacterium]|nr:T9SS type A sorting domain-containing protein [bacterium]
MKKWILFSAMAVLLAWTAAAHAAGIVFTFENGQITGDTPKYYEFDIYVAASENTKIGSCIAYVNYNTTGFGNSIEANGKVTATRGTLVTSGAVYDGPKLNDNTTTKLAVTIDYTSGDPTYGADLGVTPQQWAHIKIEISDPNTSAGLSFDQTMMAAGACKQSDNNYYDPVVAMDTDDSSLPVQMAGIAATAAEGRGVILSWQTESEVDCAGFHVWRSDDREGRYNRLTTQMIPGAGNTSSRQEYAYTDRQVTAGEEYWYQVEEIALDGKSTFFGPIRAEGVSAVPVAYNLSQNYPNPFNPETAFHYDLPETSPVRIAVYSLIGQRVATLVHEIQEAGRYDVIWDARDSGGNSVPSGIYFLVMDAGKHHQVRKMTILR